MSKKLPQYRADVEISPQVSEGKRYYHLLKDPCSGEIYDFSEEEVFLYQQFDGKTSLEDIRKTFEGRFNETIDLSHIEAFVRQLGDLGLLVSSSETIGFSRGMDDEFLQRKIFNPDRLLGLLVSLFGWCFTPLFFAVFCLFFFCAVGVMVKYGAFFVQEIEFGLKSICLVPLLSIFMVNLLGELAKGIACKKSGNQVNEMGVIMLYRFLPRFYFDIRESLWKYKKKERMQVIAAGPAFQLFLWCSAVIGWNNTHSWSGMHEFWALLIVASTIILFLNVNPLARRDGYLLLNIWLETPELRDQALSCFHSYCFRYSLKEPITNRQKKWFRIYGAAITIYELLFWTVVFILIGYLLIMSLKGVGACLFLLFLTLRFEQTLKRKLLQMLPNKKIITNEAGAVRLKQIIQLGILIILIVIMFLPYSYTVSGEFSLRPVTQYGIRAQVAGEIAEVFVKEGQWVKKGDPIAKLDGRDQKRNYGESEAALDSMQAELDLLRGGPKDAEIAKAEQEVQAAKTSVDHSKKQLNRQEELFNNKAVSEKDYDEAVKNYDLDEERLKIAEKNLELVQSGAQDEEIRSLEAKLRFTEVEVAFNEKDLELINMTSPAEGKIITAFPDQSVGQYLNKGDLFAVVENSSRLIVEIKLAEEDISHVQVGSDVIMKMWSEPRKKYKSTVVAVAPVAYEKSRGRIIRSLSAQEWLVEREEPLKKEGQVVRVLAELENQDGHFKTDMTGIAKIKSGTRPVYAVFFRWLMRFVQVEVWSWIP